ncbi:MAG: hypothetical protein ABUS79_25880 [Pseudomonadota bacterium]
MTTRDRFHILFPRLAMTVTMTLPFLVVAGCTSPTVVPTTPTWSDVAPILRGACNGCHGWTAKDTGGGYRFDFFDAAANVCGDAALAIDTNLLLAGTPSAAARIAGDVVPAGGARWARMPPQPSPALVGWEREMILRWSAQPVKGPPEAGNRPPTIAVSHLPSTADKQLSFTAIVDDPDGDAVVAVVNVAGLSFLMNRPGAFAVSFDSSTWPAGSQPISATVCDGWSNASYNLGPIAIQH